VFKNKRFPVVAVFTLAAKMLVLGIIQLVYYIPRQVETINMAVAQGATDEQVTNYIWQMIVPEALAIVIPVIGFTSVLVAIGLVLMNAIKAPTSAASPGIPIVDEVQGDVEAVEGDAV